MSSGGTLRPVDFLNRILTTRQVPYDELDKHAIREHLLGLIQARSGVGRGCAPAVSDLVNLAAQVFPTLKLNSGEFIHNDGHSAFLLKAEGTVPMVHNGVTYNIPVEIWLPELYPKAAPMAFVRPTPNMARVPNR